MKRHHLRDKSLAVGILLLLIGTCIIPVTARNIGKSSLPESRGNQTISSPYILRYTFEFKKPCLQTIRKNGAEYMSLSMAGCIAQGKQIGDPATPVKVVQLMLPPKQAVSNVAVIGTPVTVNLSGINLVAHPVIPNQKPNPIGGNQPSEWTMNSDVYSSDAPYPSTLYSDAKMGYSHGFAILSLSLNPLQYTPQYGTLVYYSKMTVVITLKNDPGVNKLYRNSPEDLAYIKTLVSNPEVANDYPLVNLPVASYPGGLCDPSEHYDYVIVTTTWNGLDHWDISGTLTHNWDDLLALHSAEGLRSTEVLVQDIKACSDYWNSSYYPLFNDTQAKAREFCKDAYSDWGTQYILFGGDDHINALPPRLMDSYAEYGVDADLYWSNLDNSFNGDHDDQWGEEGDPGFDCYHELDIGRIPCESPQDVSNWLTKSFYYADATEIDYLENTGFYGNLTMLNYSAISEFEIWNTLHPEMPYNLSVISTNVTDFKNAINNDQVTLISGVAHGDNQMSLDVYTQDWENDYHNTKPFFINDYGCHCGDFDAGNGVLDAMLFYSNTTLAFGCVYNTGYGWGNMYDTNASSEFQQKMFWDYFFDLENNSHSPINWQLGEAQGWSKDQMAPMINWSYGSWRETIQCCLLFGDPAQTIKTPHPSNPPAKPLTPVGPTLGIWNVHYNYTSFTTDLDGDQIYYLFDWDDGSNSGWFGPYSSGATVTGSHIWTALGTYDVKVKARDVWGAGSQWSDSLTVIITNNTPPSVPIITGPHNGKPWNRYLFNFQSDDAQGQNIWFFIDWGDGSNSNWLGPYISGTIVHMTHTWNKRGTYIIQVKAKDSYGAESSWGTLPVTMPLSYESPHFRFFDWLFERFPHTFPILRHLFGY